MTRIRPWPGREALGRSRGGAERQGGIPFTGGRGTVAGAALGAIIIGVINDLTGMPGVPPSTSTSSPPRCS